MKRHQKYFLTFFTFVTVYLVFNHFIKEALALLSQSKSLLVFLNNHPSYDQTLAYLLRTFNENKTTNNLKYTILSFIFFTIDKLTFILNSQSIQLTSGLINSLSSSTLTSLLTLTSESNIFSALLFIKWILRALPLYFLILLGCFCLGRLGLDIISFNNLPHEIANLNNDILEAKNDLKKRGFKF